MFDAGTYIVLDSRLSSVKPQHFSPPLCLTAYRMDGKDSGAKVVSGVSKGESILAGNS